MSGRRGADYNSVPCGNHSDVNTNSLHSQLKIVMVVGELQNTQAFKQSYLLVIHLWGYSNTCGHPLIYTCIIHTNTHGTHTNIVHTPCTRMAQTSHTVWAERMCGWYLFVYFILWIVIFCNIINLCQCLHTLTHTHTHTHKTCRQNEP